MECRGRGALKSHLSFMYTISALVVCPDEVTIRTTCGSDSKRRRDHFVEPVVALLEKIQEVEIVSKDETCVVFKSKNGISTIYIL